MTLEDFKWDAPQIGSEDELLIEAYTRIGVPLDSLAYTEAFQRLAKEVGKNPKNDEELRQVYRRLLGLRKRGMLPRIYAGESLSSK